MDKEKLLSFMKALSGDWFTCLEKEPSYASHMGGVWERCVVRFVQPAPSCLL